MNILFVNANMYGHINPTLGLVKKLTERENQVSYFCSEQFSEQVTNMGANWIGYGNKLDTYLKEYRPTDRHPFFIIMEAMLSYDEVVIPEILAILEKESYDMVICDSYFGAGCFLQRIINLPVVCSHSSFAMSHTPVPPRMLVPGFHLQLDHCYEILGRISERYHFKDLSIEQAFTSKGDRNVVYTTRNFNGDEGVHEPDYIFAGPSIDRVQESSDLDYSKIGDRKVVYISLGSMNTNFIEFYQMCILAFQDTEFYVFMSIGNKVDASQLGEVPSNITIKSFLPQLEILSRADVFITHAGFNSVTESLCFGVPMLALPQVNDQYMVAKRLTSMQLGITEDIKEMTPERLKTKIDDILKDTTMLENCKKISQEMNEFAKLEEAVIKLENFAKDWEKR